MKGRVHLIIHNVQARLRLLALALLGHPNQPVNSNSSRTIEQDISPKKSKVSPAVVEVDVDQLEERVGVGHGTIVTLGSAAPTSTVKIPAMLSDVSREKLAASRSVGGLKVQNLVRGTSNGCVCECCAEESFHHVGEWVDAVHEDPEARKHIRTGEDTTEGEHHDEDQVEDTCCGVGVGKAGNDHVRECRCKEEEHPDMKKDGDST